MMVAFEARNGAFGPATCFSETPPEVLALGEEAVFVADAPPSATIVSCLISVICTSTFFLDPLSAMS